MKEVEHLDLSLWRQSPSKGGRTPNEKRRVAPCLYNSNTLFSMCVRTPAASFGVCPQRPATTQDAVQIPAAPQSAICIVLY